VAGGDLRVRRRREHDQGDRVGLGACAERCYVVSPGGHSASGFPTSHL
jgi:hypothetical protein